jgi:hypothetical protein
MKPSSELTSDSERPQKQIKFYECDNEYCRYRTAETGISLGPDVVGELNEPLVCSKCNTLFNTELEYKHHYYDRHRSGHE